LSGCKIVIVDFHAEYMNEKKALAIDFDGKISFLAGTHTHVQTADEVIFRKGTGYITDIGMCGGIDSVIGMERSAILQKIRRQVTQPYIPSVENGKMQGVFVDIDCNTGKTLAIKRLSI
jgi:calcineurin-like phosphoesterase